MINTSGFRLSVAPQYTPVNPSLVALNPSQMMAGAGQTLSLASMLDQIQMQRALADEQAATRANRIDAINAANQAKIKQLGAEVPLYQPRADLELLKIGQDSKLLPKRGSVEEDRLDQQRVLIPLETAAKKAELNFNQQHALTETGLLPDMAGAKRADAQARREVADQTALNAELKGDLERLRMGLEEELAKTVGPLKNREALMQATIMLADIPDERSRKIAMEAMKTALIASEINKNNATADYQRGLGRQAGNQRPESKARQDLLDEAKKLEERWVGPMGLKAYWQEAYNEDGTKKNSFWNNPKNTNVLANRDLQAYFNIMNQYHSAHGIGGEPVGLVDNPEGKPNTKPQQSSGPAAGTIVSGYRFKGGNPNDKSNWEPVK